MVTLMLVSNKLAAQCISDHGKNKEIDKEIESNKRISAVGILMVGKLLITPEIKFQASMLIFMYTDSNGLQLELDF